MSSDLNLNEDSAPLSEELTLPQFSEEALKKMYAAAYHYYEHRRYSEAENTFRILTLADLNNPNYWLGLGASQQMQKNYLEAIQSYQFALLNNPQDPYLYFHMANCLFSLNEIELALLCLESLEQVAGEDEKYHHLLTHIGVLREAWRPRDFILIKE